MSRQTRPISTEMSPGSDTRVTVRRRECDKNSQAADSLGGDVVQLLCGSVLVLWHRGDEELRAGSSGDAAKL